MIPPFQEDSIFIARNGKRFGPYSPSEVDKFLNDGTLNHTDLGWTQKLGDEWKKLSDLVPILQVLNKQKEEEIAGQKQKIISLFEDGEFEFVLDLLAASKNEQLYQALFEGCIVDEEGELKQPQWVGWKEKENTYFLKILASAPSFKFVEKLRQQTLIFEHALHECTEDQFPTEIFQFKNLRVLRLTGGSFERFPSEIGLLKSLEELRLESMNIQKLPHEFQNLKNLVHLDMTGNLFEQPGTNFEIIGELDNLKTLRLDFCKLTDFPIHVLGRLKALETISLQGVELSDDNLLELLEVLSGLNFLRTISLANCGIKEIPEIKGGFANLIGINLYGNEIETLPVFFSDLPNFKWLNLDRNPIYYEENRNCEGKVKAIFQQDSHISSETCVSEIESFHEDEKRESTSENGVQPVTYLSGEAKEQLIKFKNWINSVSQIDFEIEIFDQKIDELISCGDSALLAELVRGCRVTEEGIFLTGVYFPFPYWASELFPSTSLHGDARTEWEETGWGSGVKCKEAENMHYFLLRLLPYLPQNLIDDSLKLEKIQILDLCLPGVLPKEIGEYFNLTGLNLVRNKLVDLPDELAKLGNLENLQLSLNKLTELPRCIGNLKKLKCLSLSGNNIKIICDQIEGLEKLEILDFSNNEIEELPFQIANLPELQFLGLNNNQLKSLPSEIWTLYKLKHLWVGSNLLEDLPDEIYQMDNLQILGICGNHCLPKNTEWILDREVFLSSSTKSMMLIKEKREDLKERIKRELPSCD